MSVTVTIDPAVYNPIYYPLLGDESRIQILFGGSSSGKSKFKAQEVVETLLAGGRNWLIIRKVADTNRVSTYNEICKVIEGWGVNSLFSISKTDLTITCVNGYQAIFKGLNDVEKIKSITPVLGVITDIWVEEATEITRDDLTQLRKRLRGMTDKPKRIHLTFNPIFRSHWIHEDYFEGRFHDNDRVYRGDGILILKTTYRDNLFLAQEDRDELESERDEYYYNVYTLGNWGVLGSLIFTNWTVEDLSDRRDAFGTYYNGLDFGYTNDPSAFVRDAIRGNTLFITHGFYEYGLTNPQIADRLIPIIGKEAIWCDSAEPKSIAELRTLPEGPVKVNAHSAIKGPGSVNQGIQYLKQFERIVIHKELTPVIGEFEQYHWLKDRDGNVINTPADRKNHAMDALRFSQGGRIFAAKKPNTGKFDRRLLGLPV